MINSRYLHTQKQTINSLQLLIFFILCVVLYGCSVESPADPQFQKPAGNVSLRVVLASVEATVIDSVNVTVSAIDVDTLSFSLTIQDSVAIGELDNIPAGNNRNVSVSVFVDGGILGYSGFQVLAVEPNRTISSRIELDKVDSYYPPNGSIILTVHDIDANTIPDATITIFSDSEYSNLLDTSTTDNDGIAIFSSLISGTYYYKVTYSPVQSLQNEELWGFKSVAVDGATSETFTRNMPIISSFLGQWSIDNQSINLVMEIQNPGLLQRVCSFEVIADKNQSSPWDINTVSLESTLSGGQTSIIEIDVPAQSLGIYYLYCRLICDGYGTTDQSISWQDSIIAANIMTNELNLGNDINTSETSVLIRTNGSISYGLSNADMSPYDPYDQMGSDANVCDGDTLTYMTLYKHSPIYRAGISFPSKDVHTVLLKYYIRCSNWSLQDAYVEDAQSTRLAILESPRPVSWDTTATRLFDVSTTTTIIRMRIVPSTQMGSNWYIYEIQYDDPTMNTIKTNNLSLNSFNELAVYYSVTGGEATAYYSTDNFTWTNIDNSETLTNVPLSNNLYLRLVLSGSDPRVSGISYKTNYFQ